jgi:hypothetical protein
MAARQSEDRPAAAEAAADSSTLTAQQQEIAEKYKRFESVLLRMAELTAASDPRRAALLRQAVAQSKEKELSTRFDALVKFLAENRLALAVSNQSDVQKDLSSLMELLLSENRQERLASEQARIREYLKRVNKLIKDQKSVQGQTSRDAEPKSLAEKQGRLAEDAGKLGKDIQQSEEGKAAPDADGQPSDGDPNPAQPGEKPEDKPNNPTPADKPDGKPEKSDKPGKQESGEPKPSESGKPSESPGEPSDGKPSKQKPQPSAPGQPGQPGEPGDEQPPADGTQPQAEEEANPARKRIEAAQDRMKKAQERLEEAKRKDAAEEQQEAIRELEQAKAELEKILRQLREEEVERTLAQLEGRFRRMLAMQVEVYEGTLRLDKVPAARRGRNDEIEAGRLSRKESGIALEAEKALTLLREEGSAVAMTEAVLQMYEDMQQVVIRLGQAKVDARTQAIEEDIIAALEEMIAALEQAQQDLEDQKPPPPGQSSQPGDQPLIDRIAELKMIRSLQLRVNRRTQRYTDLIEGREQAVEPDLLEALRELSGREERIFQSTRDIVTEKNK